VVKVCTVWYKWAALATIELACGLRNLAYVKHRKDYLRCQLCKKSLRLGTDTTTDENGKSVHDHCQVKRIIGTYRSKKSYAARAA
jgi:hypothetical protein